MWYVICFFAGYYLGLFTTAKEDLEIRKCLDCGKVWEDVPPIGYCPDCESGNIEEATADEL